MPVTIVGNNTPTAGGVVYGDGSNYASTAAGTSGQVLQSNGSSAPTWGAVASGLTFISSVTASNSATVSFINIGNTYDLYVVEISCAVPAVDADTLCMRFSTDNGSSYLSGGTDYAYSWVTTRSEISTVSGNGQTGISFIAVGNSASNNATFGGASSTVKIYRPSAAANTQVSASTYEGRSATVFGQTLVGAAVKNSSAKNAIRFYYFSGNITSGTFRLYGVANS